MHEKIVTIQIKFIAKIVLFRHANKAQTVDFVIIHPLILDPKQML